MSVTRYATSAQLLRAVSQIAARVGASTSPVNTTDVEAVLDEVSSEVSGVAVGLGYTAAGIVADEEAAMLVRRMVIHGAAAELLSRLSGGGSNTTSDLARDYEAKYRDALRSLRKGEMNLGALKNDAETTPGISESLRDGGADETPPWTMSDPM